MTNPYSQRERSAQRSLVDNENVQYELEVKQRFEDIAHRQLAQRALQEKHELLDSSLRESTLIQQAIEEEQRRRKEVRAGNVSALLDQAPHLQQEFTASNDMSAHKAIPYPYQHTNPYRIHTVPFAHVRRVSSR